MKFISGVYTPDGFRDYEVNDFIRQLNELCSFDYKALKKSFEARGIDAKGFNSLMQFTDIDDRNNGTTTRRYGMFDDITYENTTEKLPVNGWALMQRTFFGKPSNEVREIRKNLGYKITGGRNGVTQLDRSRPITMHSNTYCNGKRMFKWFINNSSKVTEYDPDIEENHVVIQFFSWTRNGKQMYLNQNVDTKFVVTEVVYDEELGTSYYNGHLDIDGELPNVIDRFVHQRTIERYNLEDSIYVLSSMHSVALGIMDKLKMMTTYKRAKLNAVELRNCIEILTRNVESLDDCDPNLKTQLACRVRIIPLKIIDNRDGDKQLANSGVSSDGASSYFAGSGLFNWFDPIYSKKSWSDSFSNGSNTSMEEYKEVWRELGLNYTFIQETAMQDGIFCIDMNEYREFINLKELNSAYEFTGNICQSNIISHNIMCENTLNGKTQEIISVIDINEEKDSNITKTTKAKKANQRKKLIVSRKYRIAYEKEPLVIKGDIGNQLIFNRKSCGLHKYKKQMFKSEEYKTNVLIGFIEPPDFYADLTHDEFQNMSETDFDNFCKASPGISCSSYFTEDFLHNTYTVPKRTDKISCRKEEVSEYLLEKLAYLDRLSRGEESEPIIIDMNETSHKDSTMITHYSVECEECKSRMIEGDGEGDVKKDTNFVRPTSKAFWCPTCTHHVLNPAIGMVKNGSAMNPDHSQSAIVRRHYLANKKRDYKKIIITGYKEVENGIDLRVQYYFPWANSRFTCGDFSKGVPRETKEEGVGNAKEIRLKDPFSDEVKVFKNVQLDGLMFSGATKGKATQIMNAHLRMLNLVFGKKKDLTNESNTSVSPHEKFDVNGDQVELSYEPTNYLELNKYIENDKPDYELKEINDLAIQHMQKTEVEIEQYNPVTGKDEMMTLKMYVAILSINATECSPEFKTAYPYDQPHKLSQVNVDMMYLLRHKKLVEQLRYENIKSFQDKQIARTTSELLKILTCLNNPLPYDIKATDHSEEERELHIALKDFRTKEVDYTIGKLHPRDFQQKIENRVTMSNFIDYSEYVKIRKYHPLFNKEVFKEGNFGEFVFTRWKTIRQANGGTKTIPVTERYNLRFPSNQLMYSLVNQKFSGFKVRLDGIFTAFMELFEAISTSELDGEGKLSSINGGHKVGTYAIDKLKKAIYKSLLPKDGNFVVGSSINLPSMGGKLVCSPKIPWDVVIASDDMQYKKVMEDVISGIFPGKEQDWSCSPNWNFREDGTEQYRRLGWCWTFEPEGLVHRDPVGPMPYQNMPHRVWSRHKANLEFDKMYESTFDEEFPGCKTILTNSVRSVADREEDEDGDWIQIAFSYLSEGQKLMKELRFLTLNNGMFKNEKHYNELIAETKDEDIKDQLIAIRQLSENASRSRFDYMIGERKDSMISYPEKMKYLLTNSKIDKQILCQALFEATESKKDIGFLTNSFRLAMYTFNFLYEKKRCNPELYNFKLTNKAVQAITFIFQYLLLQMQAIRAVKSDGSYGKLTFNAIITNSWISFLTNQGKEKRRARLLLRDMLVEFDDLYQTDYQQYYNVIIDVCDNYMISNEEGYGGGYKREQLEHPTSDGEIYNIIRDYSGKNIEPDFRDFQGLFHVMTGSSTDRFVKIFGEDAIFKGLHSNVLKQIPMLRSLGDDFAKLTGNEGE